MARGSLKYPFKKTGQQVGSAAGAALGTLIPIPGVGTAIGGAVGGLIGGLFDKGGNKAQAGPSAAESQMQRRLKQYERSQFVAQNPYEDMTVNLQAAEFQRQQQAQEQADVLAALRGGATGAGAGALATSLMRASVQKQQALAGQIGKQEQAIEMAQANAQTQIDAQRRAFEQQKLETLLGVDMARVTGEEQARVAAEQARMNRSSSLLGAGLGFLGEIAPSIIDGLSTAPTNTKQTTQFADVSDLSIDTSGLGQNLSLTTPSSGLSLTTPSSGLSLN